MSDYVAPNSEPFMAIPPPNFSVLSPEQIMDFMKESILEVNSVIQLPNPTTLHHLLNYYKWDKGRLLEAYYELSPRQLGTRAKIDLELNMEPSEVSGVPVMVPSSQETEQCSICFEDFPVGGLYGLRCEHPFCLTCWKTYLKVEVMGGGLGDGPLCCPAPNCKLLVEEGTVMKFLEDEPEVKGKYIYIITNTFVRCNRFLVWCQNPKGCEQAIQVKDVDLRPNPVKCSCGYEFCFNCPEGLHEPITCKLLAEWKLKIRNEADSESNNWLVANAKNCPKCETPIEKNGGCNHMSCRAGSCGHEFCWICLGDWYLHADFYRCNRFRETEEAAAKISSAAAALERYGHYSSRYVAHVDSLKLEGKMGTIIKIKMEHCMSGGLSWAEVQYLEEALDILLRCRQLLIHSYVFAYYVQNCSQKDIFEGNQADLQEAVEDLSDFLENDMSPDELTEVGKVQVNVLDRAKYCDLRRRVLINHIKEGYEKEWWNICQ